MSPLVTVVICVYNAGSYLQDAVRSIRQQTYRNLEILVVNDGSTDGCVETIRGLDDSRIRIIDQVNRGKAAAMNVALDSMLGDYYVIQDADDESRPTRIEKQLARMVACPDLAAVYCGYELIMDGRRAAPIAFSKDAESCKRDIDAFLMPSHDPTGMYRVSLVRHVRYREDLRIAQGHDYILRVGENNKMNVIDEVLYAYRFHSRSVTKKDPKRNADATRIVLKAACARRKLDPSSVFRNDGLPIGQVEEATLFRLAAHYTQSSKYLVATGQRRAALNIGLRCMMLRPQAIYFWKALVMGMSPLWVLFALGKLDRSSVGSVVG